MTLHDAECNNVTSPTQMLTIFIYRPGFSIYTNLAISAVLFACSYRDQGTRTDVDACRKPSPPHHHCVGLSPPAMRFRCRALGRYPFIWVSLSPGISFPAPIGAGLAMGAGVHGWKERGGDNAEGQLETLPKTPRRQKTAEETEGGRTQRGDICCFGPL